MAPESVVRPLGGGGERVASRVLVRPHITEKAGRVAAMNQYVFVVAEGATKPTIARAVFEIYGVRPIRVHTVRIAGKRRRIGRIEGRTAGYRKAIVTLPAGKTIEVLPK
ncbi:MAG: 50S ribosomal protein L23 [Candidatus Terrybacteria bacterium]|nr:50S ribosomal protein L23 [Candidatus Terrybacteria bacterium]